jgi:hypothetical protein
MNDRKPDTAHGSPELDEDARKLESMGADPGPTLADLDNGLTWFERGVVDKTLGLAPDTQFLGDDEATAYLAGYASVQ